MAYSYYRSVTVDHTKVGSGGVTNFPVLVSVTNATLKTVANGGHVQHTTTNNGQTVPADLVFSTTNSGGSLMNWEVEHYDATTGQLIAWVESTLSSSSDTVFYMVYGNSTISTWQSPAIPWDGSYTGVFHLPDGTTLSGTDSTGLASLTNGGAAAASGEVDGAASMSSNAYMSTGTGGVPVTGGFISQYDTSGGAWTMEAWVYFNAVSSTNQWVGEVEISGNNTTAYVWYNNSSQYGLSNGLVAGFYGSDTSYYNVVFPWTPSASTWYHVAVVGTAPHTLTAYINGSIIGSPTSPGSVGPHSGNGALLLGRQGGGSATPHCLNGVMDEFRISVGASRAVAWFLTDYNSQGSPSTFFTLGSETPIGSSFFPNPSNLQGNLSTNLRGNL